MARSQIDLPGDPIRKKKPAKADMARRWPELLAMIAHWFGLETR
jgi:hypothetical protein